jgi:peptidoglycan-N-acetylglucosamine deacetylase
VTAVLASQAAATWPGIRFPRRNLADWPRLPRAETSRAALGDHTWMHPHLPALPSRDIAAEVARTKQAIEALTGVPVVLFRPPCGAHDARVDREARALGLLEVLWSIDTRDSEGASWRRIAATVAADLRPGAIVLMHENHGQTIRALKFRILPLLRRRGYKTLTIPELVALDPPTAPELAGHCYYTRSGYHPGTPT